MRVELEALVGRNVIIVCSLVLRFVSEMSRGGSTIAYHQCDIWACTGEKFTDDRYTHRRQGH